jgi:hypothetical protein
LASPRLTMYPTVRIVMYSQTLLAANAKKAAAASKESLNHKAKTGRLDQLDDEAEALAKRERALVAKDEAQRLRREAAKAKAARKRAS